MQVSYTVTEADYLKAMAYAESRCRADLNRSLYMKALLATTSVAFALAFVSVIGLYRKHGGSPLSADLNWFVGFLLLGIVGLGAYLSRFRAISRQARLGELGHFPIEQRVAVSDEGIEFDGKYGAARCDWNAVKSIEEIGDFTFITLLGWATVLVPNSAFSSAEERSRFRQLVLSYIKPGSERNFL